jgi:hypothetical protein
MWQKLAKVILFGSILPIYHHPCRGWRQTTLHAAWCRNCFGIGYFIRPADASPYSYIPSTEGCLLNAASTHYLVKRVWVERHCLDY